MITAMAAGALVRTPEQKTAKNGTIYAVGLISTPAGGDRNQLVRITAFDSDLVRLLLALKKGEQLTATGKADVSAYQGKDGPEAMLSITATRITALAETSAKPRSRQPRQSKADGRQFDARDAYRRPAPVNDLPFDDEIPI